MNHQTGVLYFVDDNPAFRNMLDISIQSLRRFHPTLPVEVMICRQFTTPVWKRMYRFLTFWKWNARQIRANRDHRVIFAKAYGMLNTPFDVTLFVDADTVIVKPLHGLLERAQQVDVMATPLRWKEYSGFQDWQPKRFPMIMAGVVAYNRRFVDVYRPYVGRLEQYVGKEIDAGDDQYIFSLALEMEKANLQIELAPSLQIDAMNVRQHLKRVGVSLQQDVLDLKVLAELDFLVFHYNGPYKEAYLSQIRELWGLPSQHVSDVSRTMLVC